MERTVADPPDDGLRRVGGVGRVGNMDPEGAVELPHSPETQVVEPAENADVYGIRDERNLLARSVL